MTIDRKKVLIETITTGDAQIECRAYSVDLGPLGNFTVHHGIAVLVGTENGRTGPERVSIGIATSACQCGCAKPGNLIEFLPNPDHARMLAQQLIDAAAEVDAAAAETAAAALDKARGR